ncbi:aminotransferase class I/II-fold pyridoxal phosphate-dependent enzyme [Flavobacterium sp. TP390]|uniref:Aminotransferase class I/II-fold pyridoxal phosphate-dependent enzyme n=1 Tax=Flavobacterium profundi TaxID=1774945 RepID=A0A6I4ITW1_9FLAO|nr:aminotransferase class I/II-fold pyridoxal phosphate-dependent enzyme [Flavobacterium profundi]MVO10188.1 aminotransferase class I/II-fold pyridoxal phosphate-dependent enzyme [Flavobacterium profundi]
MNLPKLLLEKLHFRKENNALRVLKRQSQSIDFASNDYLGFSQNEVIFNKVHDYLATKKIIRNGATGSRLLSGNHEIYFEAESFIAHFHQSEAALIYNSGYDANVGFFSAVPQRNDVILYDELCHASIRDGIQMGLAKAYKFKHNDLVDLEKLMQRFTASAAEIYVVTEAVFSMDGDSPNIVELVAICEKHKALLVVDEAHALGVLGTEKGCQGEGLVQQFQLQNKVFARIMTFGKALGCHGAAILGSQDLKEYLVNFSRSLIYTTALSPHSVATILIAYQELAISLATIKQLEKNSEYFNTNCPYLQTPISHSSIKSIVIPGNEKVKEIASYLQENGFDVKPILSPTVPEGEERLRFCLHAYNTETEMEQVLLLLKKKLS